jgi:hypothetical protein
MGKVVRNFNDSQVIGLTNISLKSLPNAKLDD